MGDQHLFPGLNAPHRHQLVGWAEQPCNGHQDGDFNIAPLGLDPRWRRRRRSRDSRSRYPGTLLYCRIAGGCFDRYIGGGVLTDSASIGTNRGRGANYLLAGLDDGQSFVDAVNGIPCHR